MGIPGILKPFSRISFRCGRVLKELWLLANSLNSFGVGGTRPASFCAYDTKRYLGSLTSVATSSSMGMNVLITRKMRDQRSPAPFILWSA